MQRMVQYKLKADRVAENERYVLEVFNELKWARPSGLRYATFRLADGVSFVHMVSYENADASSALTALAAFKAFTAGIRDRCEEMPHTMELKEIASYGFHDA